MTTHNPTDEEIIAILTGRHIVATYVVRNWLKDKYKGITTPQVLRKLKRMEAEGKVTRNTSFYKQQYCWVIAQKPQANSAK